MKRSHAVDRAPEPPPSRVGLESALEQWRRELAAGKRTRTTFDELWRLACREAADRDFGVYVRAQREHVAQLSARQSPAPPSVPAQSAKQPSVFRPVRFASR